MSSPNEMPEQTVAEIVRESLKDENPDALFADGFDDAIVGYSQGCGRPALVIYDISKCIDVICRNDHMEYEEASEHFWFNVAGGWLGENTPIFMNWISGTDTFS